ncbi:hypothetical protein MUY14_46105 [Amycolatopsis sp. FBCC-B4732]|uniref:hypothetical protein n=1 Tax=Amycolatopsis sp. FBCC-B4732 TaxID=3079339 RepID=UPI001FF1BD67|nr:hypothetical protein [Amycolatopsis sp. FBCC-B4732]UOX88959.1 hypothetical protein MUY14_46105 [Amycolatopsis sp. FBCC-B4732]
MNGWMTLVGTVLGGMLGLWNQWSARRDAERRERRERATHRREVLRQAVDALLVSAQVVPRERFDDSAHRELDVEIFGDGAAVAGR